MQDHLMYGASHSALRLVIDKTVLLLVKMYSVFQSLDDKVVLLLVWRYQYKCTLSFSALMTWLFCY